MPAARFSTQSSSRLQRPLHPCTSHEQIAQTHLFCCKAPRFEPSGDVGADDCYGTSVLYEKWYMRLKVSLNYLVKQRAEQRGTST